MDGQKSNDIAHMLQNATDQTSNFYGNDVKTTYQLISRILRFESKQQGFNLAAMRDAKFNEVGCDLLFVPLLNSVFFTPYVYCASWWVELII